MSNKPPETRKGWTWHRAGDLASWLQPLAGTVRCVLRRRAALARDIRRELRNLPDEAAVAVCDDPDNRRIFIWDGEAVRYVPSIGVGGAERCPCAVVTPPQDKPKRKRGRKAKAEGEL